MSDDIEPTEHADLDMADDFDRAIWQIRENYSDAAEIESELRLAKSWAERVEVDYDEGPSAIGFHKDGSTYWYMIDDAYWDADDPRSELLAWVCESRAWVTAERDLLAANVAALTEDVAKQRAVIAQMRPVYDVAVAWRDTWRHRKPFGDEQLAVALVDAVDIALGNAQIAAMPTDIRADYIAAYLWLNQHSVPMFVEGKPATVAERVRMLAASRDEARRERDVFSSDNLRRERDEAKALAEQRRLERDNALAVTGRLQPLRHVLRSWNWAEIQKDGVLPRETPVESQVINAFATVERDENEAAKGRALIDAIDATTSPTAAKNGAGE